MQRASQAKPRGVAAVELAVVAPLVLLITFGVQEVTASIYLQQSLEICAYESARVALLPDTDQGNVTAMADSLLASRHVKGATVTVTPGDFDSQPYGTEITVRVTAPLAGNNFGPLFVLSDRNVAAEVVVMKEQGL
ncbi:MAG: TadE/TadG family type IV pilus assembly protein [Pirellulaceae bacterium]